MISVDFGLAVVDYMEDMDELGWATLPAFYWFSGNRGEESEGI
jgi:hypothetical protein